MTGGSDAAGAVQTVRCKFSLQRTNCKEDLAKKPLHRKGSARERWWEMMPGGVTIGSPETLGTPAGREATELVSREWQLNNERRLAAFMRYGIDRLGMDWMESASLSTAHLKLTREQLKAFGEEYQELLATRQVPRTGDARRAARADPVQHVSVDRRDR